MPANVLTTKGTSIVDSKGQKVLLHALPGYQNQAWHSDNPTHKALFWQHKHFQDRVVHLWEVIANRYKGNPWVAGYNRC